MQDLFRSGTDRWLRIILIFFVYAVHNDYFLAVLLHIVGLLMVDITMLSLDLIFQKTGTCICDYLCL
jgi:hypothetical protein